MQILEVYRCVVSGSQVQSSLRPGRSVLERQNAELEAELLQMHTNVGQLTARLDASQSLCNELQRALVDSMQPQVCVWLPASSVSVSSVDVTWFCPVLTWWNLRIKGPSHT